MLYTLRFFSSKCSLFHNANLFGSCIIHILYTRCAQIKKKNNNSGAEGIMSLTGERMISIKICISYRSNKFGFVSVEMGPQLGPNARPDLT